MKREDSILAYLVAKQLKEFTEDKELLESTHEAISKAYLGLALNCMLQEIDWEEIDEYDESVNRHIRNLEHIDRSAEYYEFKYGEKIEVPEWINSHE